MAEWPTPATRRDGIHLCTFAQELRSDLHLCTVSLRPSCPLALVSSCPRVLRSSCPRLRPLSPCHHAHYQNEVGTPSFTKKKFDKLLHFEKHKGKRSHRTDKLFGYYSNWEDYRWSRVPRALFFPHSTPAVSNVSGALPSAGGGWADDGGGLPSAGGGWADYDSGSGKGEKPVLHDDGAGVPSAMMDDDSDRAHWLAIITHNGSGADDDECSSAEAVEDDAGLMMYEDWIQPPEGDWIQPPEGAWSDPKGGMGIPATLADMMSMLHVRLLSLEAGLLGRNRYRCE